MTSKEYMDTEIAWPPEIQQYERKIYDLKQLIEISKGLNSTLDYNTLIDSILLTCMGQMQLMKAGIFLKRGIGFDDFEFHRNYKGFEVDHSRIYEIKSSSPVIRFMEKGVKCYSMQDLEKVLGDDISFSIFKLLKPDLIMPLFSRGIINGIIILGDRINKEIYTESEKEYLLNIGSLAGIAVHNVFLFEMATTDMMTKLKIHHYFKSALLEEMQKSIKNDQPLCLIMADIDSFRKFNNTYGHLMGDKVLKNVARLLRENIRPSDIAARYGGEEFAIILPGTDKKNAVNVAERFRSCVESSVVEHEEHEVSVTISIGLTEFSRESDRDTSAVISRADRALYASKSDGKNRVTFI